MPPKAVSALATQGLSHGCWVQTIHLQMRILEQNRERVGSAVDIVSIFVLKDSIWKGALNRTLPTGTNAYLRFGQEIRNIYAKVIRSKAFISEAISVEVILASQNVEQ